MDLCAYLIFDGHCEEAFKLYEKTLGGEISGLMRYADAPDGPPAFKDCDRIMHAYMQVGGRVLMGSDTPPAGPDSADSGACSEGYRKPQGFCANVTVDTPADADRVFHALAEGGAVHMPIGETFFAHRFGMLEDRFGQPWMVTCPKPAEE